MIEERGVSNPDLAPSILSMVECERVARVAAAHLIIQKGFTLKQASGFLFIRWLIEQGRDG